MERPHSTALEQPREDLLLATSHQGDTVTVEVHGTLDLATGPLLSERVQELLFEARRVRCVELDLAELEFVDVAGVRSLIRSEAQALVGGCRLVLRSPPAHLRRVLDIVDPKRRLRLHAAIPLVADGTTTARVAAVA